MRTAPREFGGNDYESIAKRTDGQGRSAAAHHRFAGVAPDEARQPRHAGDGAAPPAAFIHRHVVAVNLFGRSRFVSKRQRRPQDRRASRVRASMGCPVLLLPPCRLPFARIFVFRYNGKACVVVALSHNVAGFHCRFGCDEPVTLMR